MENPIIQIYKSYFPIEKISKDLLGYLNSRMADSLIGEEYVFEIPEIDSKEPYKTVRIKKSDQLTIYKISSSYEFQTDLYYFVTIAVGEFKGRDEHGLYEVEKCDATLKYNYDLSLYDVEFSYCDVTEMS